MAIGFTNKGRTQLTAQLLASTAGAADTLVVPASSVGTAVGQLPASGSFDVAVEAEYIHITGIPSVTGTNANYPCVRGAYGTAAGVHAIGTTVVETVTEYVLEQFLQQGQAVGGDLAGTLPSPSIAPGAVTDAKVATANKDGAATTPSLRTLGTGAQQAVSGTDARLSDARTPLVHQATHLPGGADALDLTKLFPSGATLPTLPNALYPVNSHFTLTTTNALYQHLGGSWVLISGGSGGGATPALVGLSDVTISGQSDGQVVAWSAAAGKWVAQTPASSGGGSTFTSEVTINVPSSTYSSAVLADTPIAWWRFDETTGTTAHNQMGSGELTYTDVTLGVAGAILGDTAMSSPTPGSAVPAHGTVTGLPTGSNPWTLECWIKTIDGIMGSVITLGDFASGGAGKLSVGIMTTTMGNTFNAFHVYVGGSGQDYIYGAGSIGDDSWHHIVVTYTGSTLTGYFDGAQVGQQTGITLALAPGTDVLVGSVSSTDGNQGNWDEPAIYTTALSATRVLAHYTARNATAASSILQQWELDNTQKGYVDGAGDLAMQGEVSGVDFKPSGLTGATAASRYAGATAGGPPATGPFLAGDWVIDTTNAVRYVCTIAGTPGTWVASSRVARTATLPTLPNVAYPLDSLLVRTADNSLWQNQAGAWVQVASGGGGSPTGSAGGDVVGTFPTSLLLSQQTPRLPVKASVHVAATANVTVSSPGTAIDGVALSNGDRVLLTAQTTGSENGIYVFNGSTSALTRDTDANTAAQFVSGFQVYVREGTAGAAKTYVHTTSGAITLGTTALTFVALGTGSGGGGITLQLDYTLASNQTITASAATWYDIIANQNFTVSSGSSKVELVLAASLFTAPTTITADAGFGLEARVVIDSAGTSVTKPVGSSLATINNAQYIPLCLGRTVFLTGLTAGTHTAKLQASADLAGTIYCRPAANPSGEYAAIQVIEHL